MAMRAYIKRGAIALAAIGAVVATVSGASAMTLDCVEGDWQFKLGDATNAKCYSGNDTNTIDSSFSMFGKTGWILADKSDEVAGDQKALLSVTGVGVPTTTTTTPTWTITPQGWTFQ